jgi:hypothetical protein
MNVAACEFEGTVSAGNSEYGVPLSGSFAKLAALPMSQSGGSEVAGGVGAKLAKPPYRSRTWKIV